MDAEVEERRGEEEEEEGREGMIILAFVLMDVYLVDRINQYHTFMRMKYK